jgi:uncharacterized protein (DUF362 family)
MTHPPRRLSRRAFLRLALLGGIGASAAVIYKNTERIGLVNLLRWYLRGQTERFASPARVALAACASYEADIMNALRQGWQDAGAPDLRGARVVIKPNLVDFIPGHPSFTHPRVVQALIQFLQDEQRVRSVVVGEGMTFRRDSEAVLVQSGFAQMLEERRVEFVDLNYDDLVPIPLRGGYARMSQLFMARTIAEADALISVPKLKTHHWTRTTGSIKNLFGTVPGIKYGWPKNTLHVKGIEAFLAELLDSLPTPHRVALVDGIVGMEGDGPLFGTSVDMGALIIGTDFLAVDATCARLMGFDPTQILYLQFASAVGLGQIEAARIQIAGASFDSLRRSFQPAPVGL